jgi:transposase InsO family protein
VYAFIEVERVNYPVQRLCRVMQVSASGYYAWRQRSPSLHQQSDAQLSQRVQAIHTQSAATYGTRRMRAELAAQGWQVSRRRLARLMKHLGLVVRQKRRFKRTTQARVGAKFAPNHLAQDFSATAANQKWLTDITYLATSEGWVYLAAVLDVFSRKIVGWAMDKHMSASLVKQALQMALGLRSAPKLHHSDRGSQYTSSDYLACLQRLPTVVSMSAAGNCYDNAMMESFWATLKAEGVSSRLSTRLLARQQVFAFIELWYNRQRRHSALGYLSPDHFERLHS